MLIFETWRGELRAGIAVPHRLDPLPDGFSPVFGPTREFQARLLGLQADQLRSGAPRRRVDAVPELYAAQGGAVLVYSIQSPPGYSARPGGGPRRLLVHVISRASDTTWSRPLLDSLATACAVQLSQVQPVSQRFAELKDEGRTSPDPVSAEERSAAQALRDRDARRIALSIKASGGLLLSDLRKQFPESEESRAAVIEEQLTQAGIVTREFIVLCKKSQAQTLRVGKRDALDNLAANDFRCGCGRPIIDERVEEALSISELGRALLDGSRWFSVVLIDELMSLGVSREEILLEQVAGGDEFDCIASIAGEVAFFELKDKEFSLGNAYSFGAKIAIVRPDESVIVTTDYVGNDAKDHFDRAQLAERRERRFRLTAAESKGIQYIEGLDSLRSGLEKLFAEINARRAIRVLEEALPVSGVSASVLVEALQGQREVEDARCE